MPSSVVSPPQRALQAGRLLVEAKTEPGDDKTSELELLEEILDGYEELVHRRIGGVSLLKPPLPSGLRANGDFLYTQGFGRGLDEETFPADLFENAEASDEEKQREVDGFMVSLRSDDDPLVSRLLYESSSYKPEYPMRGAAFQLTSSSDYANVKSPKAALTGDILL